MGVGIVRNRSNQLIVASALLIAFVSGVFAAELPGFRVAGRFLYDKCGEKVILRGINKMTVWTDISGASFPEIAKTGANSVRIVWVTTGDLTKFDAAIQKCRDNKMIPMVELHDATGEWSKLSICVDWWCKPEVVNVIQKHEEYLLVNIANECGNAVSEADFKSGYTDAVKKMRAAGIHVPIVIDAAKYGQDINILHATGPDILTADPDHNLLFSVHMWWPKEYGYSDLSITDGISKSVKMNLPLIVGEFGNTAAKCVGDINYKLILEECQKNEIGWLVWEWGPGNSDCESMDMTTDSKFETLRDWGLEVSVTDANSIKNTSVRPKFMETGVCEGSEVTRFTVSVISKGRGTVSISPNKAMVDSGTTVTITAVANTNNEFLNWTGSVEGKENPLTITVNKNVNLTAVFSDNGPAVGAELVTNGDFSQDPTGWKFGAFNDAKGTNAIENGEYVVTMTAAGVEGWEAQLNTVGLDISEGKSYRVSFKARAENPYELQTNIGLNEDPWTTYSGYKIFNIGTEMKTFSYEFTMGEPSDQKARIVFDLGLYKGKIYFDDISVKPIEEGSAVLWNRYSKSMKSPLALTSKGNNNITMNNSVKISGSFELINISGKTVARVNAATYTPGSHVLNFPMSNLSSGTYFVRLANSYLKFVSSPVSIVK